MIIGVVIMGFVRSLIPMYQGYVKNEQASKLEQKLNTVAESIRRDAPNFDFATMTQLTPTPHALSDKQVQVLYSVNNIDPITRTRTVTLTAQWIGSLPGSESKQAVTRTKIFTIMKTRSNLKDAKIIGTVVKDGDGTPMQGIEVWALGQNSPKVTAVTDANGAFLLNDVQISQTGVYVTVSGQQKRYYFDTPTPSFSKQFLSPATMERRTVQMPSPIAIKAPTRIQGKVKYINTTTGIPDVKIFLAKKEMLIDFELTGADANQTTDANGNYAFDNVIPGKYWIYMVGNSSVCAFGVPVSDTNPNGDYYQLNPNGYIDVDPTHTGTAFIREFSTIKRGGIKGVVRTVRYSGGQYVVGVPVPNTAFRFQRYRAFTNIDTPAVRTLLDFRKSTVFKDFYYDNQENSMGPNYWSYYQFDLPFTTDGNGNYSVSNVGPVIVDPSKDFSAQYTIGMFQIGSNGFNKIAKKPATPVFVIPPLSSPRMVSTYLLGSWEPHFVQPMSAAENASFPHFDDPTVQAFEHPKIYPGQDTTLDIYLLENSALGNVYGHISDSNGVPFKVLGDMVTSAWGISGFLGAVYDASWDSTLTKLEYCANSYSYLMNYPGWDIQRNWYNFIVRGSKYGTWLVPNALIPNPGTSRTHVSYSADSASYWTNAFCRGVVSASKKVANASGGVDFVVLSTPSINFPLALTARHGSSFF